MSKKPSNDAPSPQRGLFEGPFKTRAEASGDARSAVVVPFNKASLMRANASEIEVLSEILEHARKIK